MKSAIFTFCLSLIFVSGPMNLQLEKIDSLRQILADLPDAQKPAVYKQICIEFEKMDLTDSLLHYAEQAKKLATKTGDKANLAIANRNIGYAYDKRGNLKDASINYQEAYDYFIKEKNIEKIIWIVDEFSNTLVSNSEYDKASNILFDALKLCEEENFTQGIIKIHHALGAVFRQVKKYDKAEEHLNTAFEMEEKREPEKQNILPRILKNLGLVKMAQKDFDGAIELFNRGLSLQEGIYDDREMMMLFNSLALVYTEQGKREIAMEHYRKAYTHALASKSNDLIAAAQLNIGRQFIMNKDYKTAIKETRKGLEVANEFHLTKWQRNAYNYLYYCYAYLDDAENALENYINYRKYDDSLKIQQSQFKIADLETKYETEKKEKQIELLSKDNEIKDLKFKRNRSAMIAIIIAGLLLLFIGLYFNRLRRQKQEAEFLIKKQDMEKRMLSTVISTEDKERKRFSADLHDGLGPLLSSIKLYLSGLKEMKKKERNEMISYAKELIDESIKSVRTISNNILPVELSEKGLIPSIKSFCNKIHLNKAIEINIQDKTSEKRFEKSTEVILYRVVQELINNTIKHADASRIGLEFILDKKELLIQYQDNGHGFDFEKTIASQNQGYGLKNLQDRIKSLQGSINFKSIKEGGTRVSVHVPV